MKDNIVGVDIGKYDCMAMKRTGKEKQYLEFENNLQGYEKLKRFMEKDSVVVIESTGHYGINLLDHCKKDGYQTGILDPYLYASFRKSVSPQFKTDKKDVELTEAFISVNSKAVTMPEFNEIKPLTRLRQKMSRQLAKTKQQLVMHLDLVFPEFYREVFTKMGSAAIAVLRVYTTPENVRKLSAEELGTFLREHSQGKLGVEKAEELIKYANQSFGVENKGYAIGLKCLATQFVSLKKQIFYLEKEIEALVPETYLTTIPGIGKVNAATILAETGGKLKGKTMAQFRGFAGLRPMKYESGQYKATEKLTTRGNRYIRTALYLSALAAIKYDPGLKEFYQRKVAAGKPKKVALCHVAAKLANRVYVILQENRPYQKEGRPKNN